MDVFQLRDRLIEEYSFYVTSFIKITDPRISDEVISRFKSGSLWPDPLIQLNPRYKPAESVPELVDEGILHPECKKIFANKTGDTPKPIRLYQHQAQAIRKAVQGKSYVLTTGTGSGKSLAYIIPIVNYVLNHIEEKGIKAILVYPLNALANSQCDELDKFINRGYPDEKGPIRFARYTGQENEQEKEAIRANPPDILLTNYVMLELMLTRTFEAPLVKAASGLRFLVLDELHTYRGRQGADVALLVRRAREYFHAKDVQMIGTSATMSSGIGSKEDQQEEVAAVASKLFGTKIDVDDVIGETLERVTPEPELTAEEFKDALCEAIESDEIESKKFLSTPFACWIENTFGLERDESGNLIRALPKPIEGKNGASKILAQETDLDPKICAKAIRRGLKAGLKESPEPDSGSRPFAFRLHQFISPSETAYATIEGEDSRTISLSGQYYDPADSSKVMFPLVFCRECGREFYSVRAVFSEGMKDLQFLPREPGTPLQKAEGNVPGYLYLDIKNPWPDEPLDILKRVPSDWIEVHNGKPRIRKSRRKWLPRNMNVLPDGKENPQGMAVSFLESPFRFCPSCGVSYNPMQRSDYPKLASLGTEGRSTATTILSIYTILNLMRDPELEEEARKLLSFTDNRQDASLQAGHFNDFVEIGYLRAGLYKAVAQAGSHGLGHEELPDAVFDSLGMPFEQFALDPEVYLQARQDALVALKRVIGYRLYRDLKRGWRITAPNLEQCGLLRIEYSNLKDICAKEDLWEEAHEAIVSASPEVREYICKTLLDYMRRELAVNVSYLDKNEQERIKRDSYQHLNDAWAIDENEKMTYASILFPRPARRRDFQQNVFLSARGGYGRFLRRKTTIPEYRRHLALDDTDRIIKELLEILRRGGILHRLESTRKREDVPGYQIRASALRWLPGEGKERFYDPIRIPEESTEGSKPNAFFVNYYKEYALRTLGLESREHTAQVLPPVRERREKRFRKAELPILYCSPTLELGVDIAELNVVNMRNVPPNPANYAQRSGRAGRGGEAALVFTYCGKGSPHDQYFFERPEQMVAGIVTPPRIDICNEELLKTHLRSIWLKETNVWLGKSLKEIIDLSGDPPGMELQDEKRTELENEKARERAMERARRILTDIFPEIESAYWYAPGWLEEQFDTVVTDFYDATARWRDLYLSGHSQLDLQNKVIKDASRSSADKKRAKRLYGEAARQIDLLSNETLAFQGDFYSYRYFASEGFLPGYNFPRLPLSAYVPGRRGASNDEYIQRSRFLAISEFGPRSIIYHEGAKYVIDRVIFALEKDDIVTTSAKLCPSCGYMHTYSGNSGPDLCERCETPLGPTSTFDNLFRMRNVATRRRARINADEERRVRYGYELKTAIRFETRDGKPSYRTAEVRHEEETLAVLSYGQAARLWRINLGWRRRRTDWETGFVIDIEKGKWAKRQSETADEETPGATATRRVIPYVEDNKNSLILEPQEELTPDQMLSLQAALENGIQTVFQLEESELDSQPLPDKENPTSILFYEASEGGAGVLEQLLEEPNALVRVARESLDICHFDPDTGEDRGGVEDREEPCSRACYSCLLSYTNQSVHPHLDRKSIKDYLMKLTNSTVSTSPVAAPRSELLDTLMSLCGSSLERQWLSFLNENGLHLPDRAQHFMEECTTRPDFMYTRHNTVIYVDGPKHESPEQMQDDAQRQECLENSGYIVIRFKHSDDWKKIVEKYPSVFGGI